MAGTGIATFSDRAGDAVRGGGPLRRGPRRPGFASALFTEPNGSKANGTEAEQRARLLHYQDLIKVGLTGNLAGYTFTDTDGKEVKGSEVDYNGAPAGYAEAPGDALAYADAHDNESLFDALAFKLPATVSADDRARMQVLAMATASSRSRPGALQAGTDLLRSSHWTATPTTAATGSTPSTGTAPTATASAAACPRPPTTRTSGRTPSPCSARSRSAARRSPAPRRRTGIC